jgi:hypothetical protein
MIGRTLRWFLIVGIVTVAISCDNVSWGGMSIRLENPPGDTLDTLEAPGSAVSGGAVRFQYGPLLYAGISQGDSAIVTPVAELVQGELRPLPQGEEGPRLAAQILEDRLQAGQRMTVFHGGTRIGTFTVARPLGISSEYCPPRARAAGLLELVPSASDAQRFMALEEVLGRHWPFLPYQAIEAERQHLVAALTLGGEALNQLRAQWPAALQNIRRDLQAFHLTPGQSPFFVSTFTYQDLLEIGPAPDNSYSLLIIGEPRGNRFDRTFTWYRRVDEDGKGAPRFFSWMDWDQDGEQEILLEVLGADGRWWAALERATNGWSVTFQDSCGGLTEPDSTGDASQGRPR